MKYRGTAALLLVGLMGLGLLAACGGEETPTDPDSQAVKVTAVQSEVSIKDYEVADYDYTALFTITKEGAPVEVLPEYVESTLVMEEAGTYPVSCTYEGVTGTCSVVVSASACEITLAQEEITIRQGVWDSFNFNALFTVTVDGVDTPITADMVTSTVKEAVGEYTYTVSFFKTSKTLTVHVANIHDIELIPAYSVLEVEESALAALDVTSLFSLYVDGAAVRVTEDMIDASALQGAVSGQEVEVSISHEAGDSSAQASVTVKVVADREVRVTCANIVTYPNSGYLDLTTLFTVYHGEERIPVTSDMIAGKVNYSEEGTNEIVLTYLGKQYTATVQVKIGAFIEYAAGDTVSVAMGTEESTYNFAGDFNVSINGIRFESIPASCFTGLDRVDFSAPGRYEVTLTVLYTKDKGSPWVPAVPEQVTKTITYVVEEYNCVVDLVEEEVLLPADSESYDPLKNLKVTINGKRKALTDNPDWVDAATAYVKVVSGVDTAVTGEQEVVLYVYHNAPTGSYTEVRFPVTVDTGIVITAKDGATFTGDTLYARDLFTITEKGEPVPVTDAMITGKADLFTPGVYTVTLTYKEMTETAKVTVLDNAMKGTYRTALTTIPEPAEPDDSEDIGWGDGGWGDVSESPYAAQPFAATTGIGAFVIDEDGSMRLGGKPVTVLYGIDERTMRVSYSNNEFTLYYDDGIVVLDPDNSIRLGFTDYRRPMVFFNTAEYTINRSVTINRGSSHVLTQSFVTYSIDTMLVERKDGGGSMWYALMIDLVEKASSDTYYKVTWGQATYGEGFTPAVGVSSQLTFDGKVYPFTMESDTVGRVRTEKAESAFAGNTFKGTINGQTANLIVSSQGSYELVLGGKRAFYLSPNEAEGLKNGGENAAENTVFLYDYKDDTYGTYSYKFSLDLTAKTFTLVPRDPYYGVYEANGMYLFLDGYGTGLFNFDTTSYVVTQFVYKVTGQEVRIDFVNAAPSFTHGTGATLYIADLLNILTVRWFDSGEYAGVQFFNNQPTDGAIVNIASYMMKQIANGDLAQEEFLRTISIKTPAGELTDVQKKAAVDLSCVNFNQAGFYRFSITVSVGGNPITSYYALQILGEIYKDHALLGTFSGVSSDTGITIDSFGMVTVRVGQATYSGLATLDESGFFLRAAGENGMVTVTGTVVANGVLNVRGTGAANFLDHFAKGTVKAAGGSGYTLRVITTGAANVFLLYDSANVMGRVVAGEIEQGSLATNGTVIALTLEDGSTLRLNVAAWGDLEGGLSVVSAA